MRPWYEKMILLYVNSKGAAQSDSYLLFAVCRVKKQHNLHMGLDTTKPVFRVSGIGVFQNCKKIPRVSGMALLRS